MKTAFKTQLIISLIVLYSSTVIIQTVNGQVCGNGVPTIQTSLCLDVPDNDPCSQANNCRVRIEFKPLANKDEGVEIILSGMSGFSSPSPYIRLDVNRQADLYFHLFCDQFQTSNKSQIGTASDIFIKVTNLLVETPTLLNCSFEVTPTKPAVSRTANSFDPSNEYNLTISYGNRVSGGGTYNDVWVSDVPYRFAATNANTRSDKANPNSGWSTITITIILVMVLIVIGVSIYLFVQSNKKIVKERQCLNETVIAELWNGETSTSTVASK